MKRNDPEAREEFFIASSANLQAIGLTRLEQAKRRWDVFLQTVGAAIAPFVEVGSQFLEPASVWLLNMVLNC